MQAPFWKATGAEQQALQKDFVAVAKACSNVGISMMVVPLVDNGRIENTSQEDTLVSFLLNQYDFLSKHGIHVIFESDFQPDKLNCFISRLDRPIFGINYDTGNSAALGFDPTKELSAYGHRVVNVHIKDRVLNGTTVPLGTGSANFDAVFTLLARIGYTGNFILQTARAKDDNHAGVLCSYRDMTLNWLETYGI